MQNFHPNNKYYSIKVLTKVVSIYLEKDLIHSCPRGEVKSLHLVLILNRQ